MIAFVDQLPRFFFSYEIQTVQFIFSAYPDVLEVTQKAWRRARNMKREQLASAPEPGDESTRRPSKRSKIDKLRRKSSTVSDNVETFKGLTSDNKPNPKSIKRAGPYFLGTIADFFSVSDTV